MTAMQFATTRAILRFEGRQPAGYWRKFALLLVLAVVIATMGLLRNSPAVVIAAMLIAPLMTPILGIAACVVMGWTGRALRLLLIVGVAAVLSVFLAWLIVRVMQVPGGLELPAEVLGRTTPGIEDLVVALAAGIAGAYVQIRRSETSLLPGAAIGVSLVPPLADAGILLALDKPDLSLQAVILFATNFGAIVLSAAAVYITIGAGPLVLRRRRRSGFAVGLAMTLAAVFAVLGPLTLATRDRLLESEREAALSQRILDWAGPVPLEIIRIHVRPDARVAEVWAMVDLPLKSGPRAVTLTDALPPAMNGDTLKAALHTVLEPDYAVILRVQTRFGWVLDLRTDQVLPLTPQWTGGFR